MEAPVSITGDEDVVLLPRGQNLPASAIHSGVGMQLFLARCTPHVNSRKIAFEYSEIAPSRSCLLPGARSSLPLSACFLAPSLLMRSIPHSPGNSAYNFPWKTILSSPNPALTTHTSTTTTPQPSGPFASCGFNNCPSGFQSEYLSEVYFRFEIESENRDLLSAAGFDHQTQTSIFELSSNFGSLSIHRLCERGHVLTGWSGNLERRIHLAVALAGIGIDLEAGR
jgi:hypothetical protein